MGQVPEPPIDKKGPRSPTFEDHSEEEEGSAGQVPDDGDQLKVAENGVDEGSASFLLLEEELNEKAEQIKQEVKERDDMGFENIPKFTVFPDRLKLRTQPPKKPTEKKEITTNDFHKANLTPEQIKQQQAKQKYQDQLAKFQAQMASPTNIDLTIPPKPTTDLPTSVLEEKKNKKDYRPAKWPLIGTEESLIPKPKNYLQAAKVPPQEDQ